MSVVFVKTIAFSFRVWQRLTMAYGVINRLVSMVYLPACDLWDTLQHPTGGGIGGSFTKATI